MIRSLILCYVSVLFLLFIASENVLPFTLLLLYLVLLLLLTQDNDGFLTVEELRRIMTQLGDRLPGR